MANDRLVARWFELTREIMPGLAAERDWPVTLDHCFQRILLDNAAAGSWREHIAAPAYRRASDEMLAYAIDLGNRVLAGQADLHELNRNSLWWRGKLPGRYEKGGPH